MTVRRMEAAARAAVPGLRVQAGGAVLTQRAMDASIERDLRRAELLAAPLLFPVLVFAYGSVVSALLVDAPEARPSMPAPATAGKDNG
ncbi:MMPL family transporter [Streptomyces sp. NPDC060000]|uniref:MMPL family transporter n=1 Tax=Streptomyces sp. NPDC060000 TaxID=3347031 RepID=UPI0036C796B8